MAKVKTAEKIFSCASKMFANSGYSGTIMDELAAACGVNKASIYYHYKDKETLYEKVLVTLLKQSIDTIVEAVKEEHSGPAAQLRTLVLRFAQQMQIHQELASILMREVASGGTTMPVAGKEQMFRLLSTLDGILRQGHADGEFEEVDSVTIHFMIIGSLNFYIASAPMRQQMSLAATELNKRLSRNNIDQIADQLAEMIIKSIKREKQ